MGGWLLTFHLVGGVLWFGALLGFARVLAFHAAEPPSVRPILAKLERRLNWLVAVPGALLTIGCGAAAVRALGLHWLRVSLWMQAKLVLVLLLALCHLGAGLAQRRWARLDPNQPIARGGWRALPLVLVILLTAIVALSVQRPLVGGG